MNRKRWLCVLLAALIAVTLLPAAAFAAGGVTVTVGGTPLNEGANSIGGGTATLDSAAGTLTLENVAVNGYVKIETSGAFTVIVKGQNSVTSDGPDSAMFAFGVSALNVQMQQGASFALSAQNANAIYCADGALNVSGPGSLKTVTEQSGGGDRMPAVCAQGDIVLSGGLEAEMASVWHGICSLHGNITLDSVNATIRAQGCGLFAEIYDSDSDADIPSSVTLKNSTVDIDTAAGEMQGVYCGTGGILVEDTVLTTKANKSADLEGYSLYSAGGIAIRGEHTRVQSDDGMGIVAEGGILKIEGGSIDVSSTDVALLGWDGVQVTGGTVKAHSAQNSAILARDGAFCATGAQTSVTATSDAEPAENKAVIRNFRDGGIHLGADVTAVSTKGGRPFEGVMKDKSTGITFGEGVSVLGASVETEDGKSYLVSADGRPLTGAAEACLHSWGAPAWSWAADHSSAAAVFTCAKNASHTVEVKAAVDSAKRGNDTVYTASAVFGGKTYTDEKVVAGQTDSTPVPAQKQNPKTGV